MTREEAARAACALLNDAPRGDAPLIAAIDGAGGAGKSTLANAVRVALADRVSIVRCDDFYRPLAACEGGALTPRFDYVNYFDWQRLRDEALRPLRNANPARYRRYDWSTDRLAEWIEVTPKEIVLVEGVYAMRPELRPFIDVAIFVDAPRDERKRRMMARAQNSTAWIERWMAAEDWYLAHVEPVTHADLVVRGF